LILYPTIEILNGKCVSLTRGNLDQPEIWHVDPVKKAVEFADAGAEWMQITDFNAIDGDDSNEDLICEIIRAAGLPVQLAGGFRTMERIKSWMDWGVGRIVMSTAAVKNPDLVKHAAKLYPDQIVLSLDVFNGKILTDGWREETMFRPAEFLKAFDNEPLAGVIYTDINADLDGLEVATSGISTVASSTRLPVIASGLVRSVDDISMLKYAGQVSGAIVGRALFNRTIDLDEALAVARPQVETVADFI